MAGIPKALVKRTVYRKETNHDKLKDLIIDYIAAGREAPLFLHPHIQTSYYDDGDAKVEALGTAISDYNNNTNGGSITTIRTKMDDVVDWIDGYADQVEVISNDPLHRATQAEAIANIGTSGLPTQKVGRNTKGKPTRPVITAERAVGGKIKIGVPNGHSSVYSSLTVLAVSVPAVTVPPVAPASVTAVGDQLIVACAAPIHVLTKSIKGHPTDAVLEGANPLLSYDLYAVTQNGVKLVSDISIVVTVHPS